MRRSATHRGALIVARTVGCRGGVRKSFCPNQEAGVFLIRQNALDGAFFPSVAVRAPEAVTVETLDNAPGAEAGRVPLEDLHDGASLFRYPFANQEGIAVQGAPASLHYSRVSEFLMVEASPSVCDGDGRGGGRSDE